MAPRLIDWKLSGGVSVTSRRERSGARGGWEMGVLGAICAHFEEFGGEIEGCLSGEGIDFARE